MGHRHSVVFPQNLLLALKHHAGAQFSNDPSKCCNYGGKYSETRFLKNNGGGRVIFELNKHFLSPQIAGVIHSIVARNARNIDHIMVNLLDEAALTVESEVKVTFQKE